MTTIKKFKESLKGLPKEEKINIIRQTLANRRVQDKTTTGSYANIKVGKNLNSEEEYDFSTTDEQLENLQIEIERNHEAYESKTSRKELKPFMCDRNYDWFYNSKNIPNQDFVFDTIEYFTNGPRKGFFEPLDFLNLLWAQYTLVNTNIQKAHSTIQDLKAIPLTEEEHHVLLGFVLKWFGGYPVNQLNGQYNTTLRLIEREFLSFKGETPEKEFCRKDWKKKEKINEVEEVKEIEKKINGEVNNNLMELPLLGSETPKEIEPKLGNFTNNQIVLIFYYFFKHCGINLRVDIDIAPVAKFLHLITGKDFKSVQNSDFYQRLLKAPNFKKDKELIPDLEAIKPLFQMVKLNEIVKMIENELDTARTEIKHIKN